MSVELTVDDFQVPVTTYTGDVSMGGMFITMNHPRPVGSQARFRIHLPTGEEVSGLASVVWLRMKTESLDRPSGAGYVFDHLLGESESRLAEVIGAFFDEKWQKASAAEDSEDEQ